MKKIIIDHHLSPALAGYLATMFGIEAYPARDLYLQRATDIEIWEKALLMDAVVVTKDRDFLDLQRQHGSPPRIIYLTTGNTSNLELRRIITRHADAIRRFIYSDSPILEISNA
jgi:predicted nuclease of predicted toxin-antitoxin system